MGNPTTMERLARYRFLMVVAVLFFLSISIVGFTVKFLYLEKSEAKLRKLERALMDLKAAMNVDSVRQFNIQKIMAIIDKYNKDLPSSQKYEIANTIYEMSLKYSNLDVDLICATITHETGETWKPDIISKAGAIGLMQIMPVTGIFLAAYEGITWTSPEEVLTDPIYNIRLGCRYLSTLIESYGLEGGLAAYNGGEKRAATWIANNKSEGILWDETSQYIPAVLNLYEQYKGFTMQ